MAASGPLPPLGGCAAKVRIEDLRILRMPDVPVPVSVSSNWRAGQCFFENTLNALVAKGRC